MRNGDDRAGGIGSEEAGLALALALALGFLADRLLWTGPRGPGFALWILLLGSAAVFLVHRSGASWVRAAVGWSAVAVTAASAVMLRDAPETTLAMWLVVLTSASMVLLRAGGVKLGATRPADHVLGLGLLPGRAAVGVLPLLRHVDVPDGSSRRRLAGVGRGAVLAVPLLLVFGSLFASADAAFNRYAMAVVTFWSEDLLAHTILTLVFTWIAAGLLSGVGARRLPDPFSALAAPRLGREETAVVLGLLSALFLAFVGLQLGYLFGGQETIEATSGLTVAEYARRGFFELMLVGLGTLGVLLVGDALSTSRRLFRILAGVLVACVLVMLVSAAQRLALYTDAFGLTVDRVTAAVVMAWVAAVLLLFAATVLRERPLRFASGSVLAGMVAAFALVALNPAGLAARSNLDRAAEGVQEADVAYLTRLGADAVPTLITRLDELPAEGRCRVAEHLLHGWADGEGAGERGRPVDEELDDWRTWNAAQAAARDAVNDNVNELRALAGGCGQSTEENSR